MDLAEALPYKGQMYSFIHSFKRLPSDIKTQSTHSTPLQAKVVSFPFFSFSKLPTNKQQRLERVHELRVFPIGPIEPLAVLQPDVTIRGSDRGFLAVLTLIVPPYED